MKEGDILVTRIPSEEGISGKNIYGEELPPELPKEKHLKIGKNITYEEENNVLKAGIDGQVIMSKDGTVHVYEVYEVSGDLDISISEIVRMLSKKGIVENESELTDEIIERNASRRILYGTYEIPKDMKVEELVDILTGTYSN